ncbi:GNAT family N-acetyltransferase [Flocculibacter collagenilyticus]|uniref:GNAT family N-acetyltransferase n=1 Tax=Flocculibacter collagenilyticus TaxID=2744479 RepID=UPI0018F3F6C1|nr:GNAT family N-acetyltransferase [Flocculibacter collagenilyticus]
MEIITISNAKQLQFYLSPLSNLLFDCVTTGASIGFTLPFSLEDAMKYWQSIANDLEQRNKILLVAIIDNQLVGSVQLSLCIKDNARHRAEVEKLMVLSTARGKGVAKALMIELESYAQRSNRYLLVLDTRVGDIASILYQKIGYIAAGTIPNFTVDSNNNHEDTCYFYKNINYS